MSRCEQNKRELGLPPANPADEDYQEPLSARVDLRVTVSQKAAWTACAAKYNTTPAEWIRDRLDDALLLDGDKFVERRSVLLRTVDADLIEILETHGSRNPRLAADLQKVRSKIATLEDMSR